MTKAELIRKLTRLTGIPDSEAKIFFENFLVRTSEILRLGEAIKLNGFGYFQLKRGMFKNVASSISKSNIAYADLIIFTPLNQNEEISENLVFNIPSLREDDFHYVDLFFSLSIGKPIIPMQNINSDDFFIPPSGLELKKLLNYKIDKLLNEVEIINKYVKGSELLIIDAGKNDLEQYEFNWDNVISDNLFLQNNSKLIPNKSNISESENLEWNFGEDLTKQIEEEMLLDTTKDSPSVLDYDFNNGDIVEWNFGKTSLTEEAGTENNISEKTVNSQSDIKNENSSNKFTSIDFRKEIVHETNNFEKINSLTHEFPENNIDYGVTKSEQNLSWDFKRTSSNLKNNNVKIENEIFVDETGLNTPDYTKDKLASDDKNFITEIPSSKENIKSNKLSNEKKFNKEKHSKKSSLRTKSSFFLFIGLIVIIFVGVFFYAAITKFNVIQVLNGGGKISKKANSQKTIVIDRNYKIPVDYPYPKKELNSGINNSSKISASKNVNLPSVNDKNLTKVKNNIYGYAGNYIIQISSWKSKSIASKEAYKFKKMGLNSYVEKANVNGRGAWFRVKISGFKTLSDAEKYLSLNK